MGRLLAVKLAELETPEDALGGTLGTLGDTLGDTPAALLGLGLEAREVRQAREARPPPPLPPPPRVRELSCSQRAWAAAGGADADTTDAASSCSSPQPLTREQIKAQLLRRHKTGPSQLSAGRPRSAQARSALWPSRGRTGSAPPLEAGTRRAAAVPAPRSPVAAHR